MYWYEFFFQSFLLQPLESTVVRTNNECILGFALENLLFVRTKEAGKRTLWKKNLYGIYDINNSLSTVTRVTWTYYVTWEILLGEPEISHDFSLRLPPFVYPLWFVYTL